MIFHISNDNATFPFYVDFFLSPFTDKTFTGLCFIYIYIYMSNTTVAL